VLRHYPDDADSLYELATCRTRLGRLAPAADTAERFAALPGQRARGDLLLGAILADAGKPEEAERAYARTLALTPDGTDLQVAPEEFFQQYATILMNLGRGDEAIPLLEKGLAARPTAAAHHLLGKARTRAGDEEGARLDWIAAINLDPAAVSPREELAAAAIAKGDAAAAREWLAPMGAVAERRFQAAYLFQRLAAIEKDDDAFARWKEKADSLRNLEGRITALEQMMAGSPDSYWSQVVRAHKFATLGNWQQATDLIAGITPAADEHPFVAGLREAVRTRGPLPSLDEVPLEMH
jgi:tetratricopeptide (TPR) repeat protein